MARTRRRRRGGQRGVVSSDPRARANGRHEEEIAAMWAGIDRLRRPPNWAEVVRLAVARSCLRTSEPPDDSPGDSSTS